jgi:hypothetical protein
MAEDAVCISEVHLRSRGPMWPVAKSGNEGEADATTGPQRPENSAEPGPERPATQCQEQKTKAKRIRPPSINDQRTPLSRGPSGLPRSAKSRKRRRSGCDYRASTTQRTPLSRGPSGLPRSGKSGKNGLHFCRDDR